MTIIDDLIDLSESGDIPSDQFSSKLRKLALAHLETIENNHINNTRLIEDAYTDLHGTVNALNGLNGQIKIGSGLSSVIDAANPFGSQSGFSLKETMEELAETYIKPKVSNQYWDGDDGLANVISNVLDSNVVKSFVSSNPILATVSNMASSIFSYRKPFNGDIVVQSSDVQNFISEIREWVDHFEQIALLNSQYQNEVNTIYANYRSLDLRFNALTIKFLRPFMGDNFVLTKNQNKFYNQLPDQSSVTSQLRFNDTAELFAIYQSNIMVGSLSLAPLIKPLKEETLALTNTLLSLTSVYVKNVEELDKKNIDKSDFPSFTPEIAKSVSLNLSSQSERMDKLLREAGTKESI